MSEMSVATSEIFGALPVEAQAAFTTAWDAALKPTIARRGPVPDPEQEEATRVLAKLFFVHGYMAAERSARERFNVVEDQVREIIKQALK
jgi:hypothetical protein